MFKLSCLLLLLTFTNCRGFDVNTNVIYLIGDSTMSNKTPDKRPETGWGEILPSLLLEGIKVENQAKNGRSSRSFIKEKRWERILNKLRKEDVVLIQFGHNETKSTEDRFSTPSQYEDNLLKLVREAKQKKAIPILITPIVRRRFNAKGQFYDTHGKYPDVVRKIAKKEKITLIDLHKLSKEKLTELGEDASISLFLFLEEGVNVNYPKGIKDNTHFSPKGARIMAELVVAEIQKTNLHIKKLIPRFK